MTRVVIAEDEAVIRMDLREILQEHGCEVVGEAKSGIESIEVVRATRPDCVFLDIQMLGGKRDGLDAARVICAEKIAPIVMLTAFSQEAFVKEAVQSGVMAYVSKPFSEGDIMPALSVAVSRFEQERAFEREVDQLSEQLEARKVIERAKGILMKSGIDEAEAFERLRTAAMNARKPLKDIAQTVITANQLGA